MAEDGRYIREVDVLQSKDGKRVLMLRRGWNGAAIEAGAEMAACARKMGLVNCFWKRGKEACLVRRSVMTREIKKKYHFGRCNF